MSNQEDVQRLTPEEKELFDFLRSGNYRLEQEKIPQEYVLDRIPRCTIASALCP